MPKTRSKKSSRTAKPAARKSETRVADVGDAGAAARSSGGKRAAGAKPRKNAGTKSAGGHKKTAKKAAARQQNGAIHAHEARNAQAHDGGPRAIAAPKRRKAPRRSAVEVVQAALDDMKAQDVSRLDVRHLTSVTDTMIVASGRSDRHVRAVADAVIERAKQAGYAAIGVEGKEAGEWVLVDLADVVVHVMLPRVRDFYKLESLWDINARDAAAER
jgi:ribosome-associated protein